MLGSGEGGAGPRGGGTRLCAQSGDVLQTLGEPWDKGNATVLVQGDDPGPQVIPL